jgi:hypothetical protein
MVLIPAPAHADGPIVNASATCAGFTIHAEGLTPTDRLYVNQGSNPPAHPIISAEGIVDTVLVASMNPWYTADVVLNGEVVYHALVDCTTPEYEGVPAVDPAPVVVPKLVAAPVERPRRVTERLVVFGLR